ncbi:MAG: HDOD domain-containing protein, partial [Fimbriimonas ginsengisoli]|nr:HDOD domain-containing protein [Fimbriimonas ginsengisoli]
MLDQNFETLRLLFTRSNSLPHLRASALKLVDRIDSGASSAAELEKVIAADPALTAKLLKAATSVVAARDAGSVTTIRSAILHLGHDAVRSISLSLAVQSLVTDAKGEDTFDARRFARHSLFVGVFASFLFRHRAQRPTESTWSPEEVFAGGVLHDLSEALLFRVAPDVYVRTATYARHQQIPYAQAFQRLYEHPLCELGTLTVEAWRLPTLFREVILHADRPWLNEREYSALCCVHFADAIAERAGFPSGPEPLPV